MAVRLELNTIYAALMFPEDRDLSQAVNIPKSDEALEVTGGEARAGRRNGHRRDGKKTGRKVAGGPRWPINLFQPTASASREERMIVGEDGERG